MNDYLHHPVVLLGGGYNALSAARSLGRAGCDVHLGLDAGGDRFAVASKFVRSWMRPLAPTTASSEWLDWLDTKVPSGSVIIPCSDPALELVACHRTALLTRGLFPNESDDALVLSLLDKERTYELARAAGVRAPRTEVVTGVEQGLVAAASFALPFAVKPRLSHRFLRCRDLSPKAVVIRQRGELEPQLRRIVELELPVILTEIVPGEDDEYVSYYGYVDDQGRPLIHVTKRKLRQHPIGFGSGTYHITDANPEVAELGARLFEAVGLRGIGNVEFKRDARDGELTLIECNLRLTAATDLVRRAGVDLADIVYRRALGLSVEPVEVYRQGLRQWLPVRDVMAMWDYRQAGSLTARQWLASVSHAQSFPIFDAGDLRPTAARGAELAQRVVRSSRDRLRAPHPARLSPAERLLRMGLVAGSGGKLTRALLAEAGLLTGAGPDTYLRRWRTSSPLEAAAPGRSALYQGYWNQAAERIGAAVEDLGGGLLRIGRGAATTLVWDSLVPLDDPLVLGLAGDKPATRALLRAAGVTVSDQVVCGVTDFAVAAAFLDRVGVAVVKPARSGGGSGVTCGVRSPDELVAAFAVALRSSDRVVVERRVVGHEYRLLVLDGSVVSAVLRRPPAVVGDGRASIGDLVARENSRRRADPAGAGLYPLSIDLDLVLTLRRAGLRLRSVPANGERVTVKTAVNENGPSDNDLVVPPCAVVTAATTAAAAVGVELAAVEVITPEPDRPLAAAGGVVVEVNTTPGLHYHYQVTRPDDRSPVAAVILEHLLSRPSRAAGLVGLSPRPATVDHRLHVG